jgi:hypothetical protein
MEGTGAIQTEKELVASLIRQTMFRFRQIYRQNRSVGFDYGVFRSISPSLHSK